MSEPNANKSYAVFMIAAGLGNMIQTIVRGIGLCKTKKIDQCLFWWFTNNPLVIGNLTDLFDFDATGRANGMAIYETTREEASALFLDNGIWDKTTDNRAMFPVFRPEEKRQKTAVSNVPTMLEAKAMESVKIYQTITPSDKMRRNIDAKCVELISSPVLGLHIRRTDQKESVKRSGDDKFIKVIDSVIDQYTTIFLATDSSDVEKTMEKRYGSKIRYTAKKPGDRWGRFKTRKLFVNLSFYEEAMVDMWLLGKCDTILGSYKSSFSKTAFRVATNPKLVFKLVV